MGCGSEAALTGLDLWTTNFGGCDSSLLHTRSSSVTIQYALRRLTLFHCVPDSLFPPLLQWSRLRCIILAHPGARHFKAAVDFWLSNTFKMILHSFLPAQLHTALFDSLSCPVPPYAG